jgi:molybdopterin molybdotransferase
MAQLSDDCFAFGGPMMSVDQAVRLIAERVTPVLDVETVTLAGADGRILGKDVSAPLPLPPFTNSAVDGYAISSRDLPQKQEQAFAVTGRVQAGGSAMGPVERGQAVRIFTGAPMPEGADTVFMQEDVRVEGDKVVLPAGLKPGANVRPAGEDIAKGFAALKAGQRLRPQDVALVAAFGLTQLDVVRRIRVAVFSTGDELASPGEPRAAAQLFDSNRFMLMAMLSRLGCDVSDLGIIRDDQTSLAHALQEVAGTHDLILTTGGVSTGEEDHVKASVESVGRLVLWRMAIKPGRPVAMGIIGGTPFIGLPGNPVASFVTFVHVVRPTILALSGAMQEKLLPMPVRAGFSYKKKIARREYVRVSLRKAADDTLEAVKFPREGAGLLSSLVDTAGLVELGEDVTLVEPGQMVGFLSYASLLN